MLSSFSHFLQRSRENRLPYTTTSFSWVQFGSFLRYAQVNSESQRYAKFLGTPMHRQKCMLQPACFHRQKCMFAKIKRLYHPPPRQPRLLPLILGVVLGCSKVGSGSRKSPAIHQLWRP